MNNNKKTRNTIMAERKRYVHLFETVSDFNAAYEGEDYHEPWVSYTLNNSAVTYNKSEHEKMKEVPLTFEITSNGNITWSYCNDGSYENAHTTIQYKKNDGEWTNMPRTLSVASGDAVQFKGDNGGYGDAEMGDGYFNSFSEATTAGFILKGNIMSLIDSTGFTTASTLPTGYYQNFNSFFYGCTGLTSAKNLILPVTALTIGCYQNMFSGCTSLTKAPELPATTLANGCYMGMFDSCTSLTSAPVLPATTLADFCYKSMFQGCTSLTKAPVLPATSLTQYCYYSMFEGCTSLTKAPELPAQTLNYVSYNQMFRNCTNLNYIKCLATSFDEYGAEDASGSWVSGVASSGTFVKAASMTDWPTGVHGIPNNWTVQNA